MISSVRFGEVAGAAVVQEAGVAVDGFDQTDLLLGKSKTGARDHFFYFCQNELHGVRNGRWKLLLPNLKKFYGYVDDKGSGKTELYDLNADIGETKNVAEQHPEIVAQLLKQTKGFQMPKKIIQNRIRLAPRKKKKK